MWQQELESYKLKCKKSGYTNLDGIFVRRICNYPYWVACTKGRGKKGIGVGRGPQSSRQTQISRTNLFLCFIQFFDILIVTGFRFVQCDDNR